MAKPTKSAAKKSTPAKPSAVKAKTKAAAKAPAPKVKPSEKNVKSKSRVKAKVSRDAVPEMSAAPKRGAVREHREEAVEKPVVPAKPLVDSEFTTSMRDALAAQRQRLLAVVQTTQAQMAEKSGDLADLSDRASEGFEDELDMGLMAIEAAQLEDIEAAIRRIDEGSYGLCVDCAKAIPRKRLEVLPFARRCLACEGLAERRMKVVEEEAEEEDFD